MLFYTGRLFSQELNMDTIYVNKKNTSYIILPQKIDLVDIGNPQQYAQQFQENSVFLKALAANADFSTILIKCGSDYYFGILKYSDSNKKFMYDFKVTASLTKKQVMNLKGEAVVTRTTIMEGTNGAVTTENTADTKDSTGLAEIVGRFIKIPKEHTTMGFISPFIDAAVTAIRNDKDKTYLKFVVHNKASLPYKLDFISFQYFLDKQKGPLKKSKKVGNDVFPLYTPNLSIIPPLKTTALGYVVPSFALANKGYLMVIFREEQGDRVLKIKIIPEHLLGAKLLEDDIKNGK
jgi:hypothetical protein